MTVKEKIELVVKTEFGLDWSNVVSKTRKQEIVYVRFSAANAISRVENIFDKEVAEIMERSRPDVIHSRRAVSIAEMGFNNKLKLVSDIITESYKLINNSLIKIDRLNNIDCYFDN